MSYSIADTKSISNKQAAVSVLLILALILVLMALLFGMMVAANAVTLFEDGSATLAGRSLGCIISAWGCN